MKHASIVAVIALIAAITLGQAVRAQWGNGGGLYDGWSPNYGTPCCVDYYTTRVYEFGHFQPAWRPWPMTYTVSTTVAAPVPVEPAAPAELPPPLLDAVP